MNHRANAWFHKLPACVECDAAANSPCVTPSGQAREPHRVRVRIKVGDLFVISEADARAAHRLRAIRELDAAVHGTAEPSQRASNRRKRSA